MAYNMLGTGKGAAKAKPTKESAARTPARRSPENEMAYQRVLRLTTSPRPAHNQADPEPLTNHGTHFYHVLDVLASGANQVQDRRDVSHDTIDRMHTGLHKAMLHLVAHSAADHRGRADVAAGHLNEAATHLSKVSEQVGKHLGPTITHTDGSQYPTSFLKEHVMQLSKHYQTKVANNSVIKAGLPEDEHTLGPNSVDQMKAAEKEGGDNRTKMDTSPAANVLGRVTHLSEMKYPEPHTLPAALREKGPTDFSPYKRPISIAEERLANLPPKMTVRDHIKKAHADLETKGKIHKVQYDALKGKVDGAGNNIIDRLHELTGVPKPTKAGTKMSGTNTTPAIRDREVK